MGGHVTMRLVASQGSCAWVWCGVTVTRRLPGAQCPCVLVTRAANEPSRSFHCAWRRPLLFSLLKALTSAFSIKNLLRHYAKQAFSVW